VPEIMVFATTKDRPGPIHIGTVNSRFEATRLCLAAVKAGFDKLQFEDSHQLRAVINVKAGTYQIFPRHT